MAVSKKNKIYLILNIDEIRILCRNAKAPVYGRGFQKATQKGDVLRCTHHYKRNGLIFNPFSFFSEFFFSGGLHTTVMEAQNV